MLMLSLIAAVCTQAVVGQFLNYTPAPMGQALIKERQVYIPDLPAQHIVLNPSMVRYHGQTIMVFRRDLKPGRVAQETQLALVPLDGDFQPTQAHQVFDTRMPGAMHHTSEDPRLFVYKDALYILFNQTTNGMPDGLRKIYLAKVDVHYDVLDGYQFELVGYSHIDVPLPNIAFRAEKNWVFLPSGDVMRIAYKSNPMQVFRVPEPMLSRLATHDEIMLAAEPYWPAGGTDMWIFGEIRGGTPGIDDGHGNTLACFHSGIESYLKNRYSRAYLMGCYTYESHAPYAITAITEKPVLPPSFYKPDDARAIVFPGGMFELGGILHILYGINDNQMWVADVDKRMLVDAMTPVRH